MARFIDTDWRRTTMAWALILAFSLGVASLTYATLQLRILAYDGADFTYYIVTRGSSVRNFSLYRYSAELVQIPALLSARLFGFGSMPLTRTILAFSNAWFPVIGTLAAVALCFKYRKPEISLGPLLTFGIVSLPLAGLPFSAVPEAIFFFWIVYLIQVYGQRSFLGKIALSFFCLPLAFAHETALLLAMLLLCLAIWQKYWFAVWLHILTLAVFAIRVFDMSQTKISQTTSQAWNGFDKYTISVTAFLSIMLVSTAIARFLLPTGRKWACRVNVLLGSAILIYFVSTDFPLGQEGIYDTYIWRMFGTSLLALIAATFWLMDTGVSKIKAKYDTPFASGWWRYIYASAFAGLLIGAAIDYRGTLIWRSELGLFREHISAQTDACIMIPWRTFRRDFGLWQLQPYSVSRVWALIQEDSVVDKFVYVDFPEHLSHLKRDICAHLYDDQEQIDAGYSEPLANSFNLNRAVFRYSFLKEK